MRTMAAVTNLQKAQAKSKHTAAVPWYTCLYLSVCSWGPHEQKVMFSTASFHCSLSSMEIFLVTRGCGVGFDL